MTSRLMTQKLLHIPGISFMQQFCFNQRRMQNFRSARTGENELMVIAKINSPEQVLAPRIIILSTFVFDLKDWGQRLGP